MADDTDKKDDDDKSDDKAEAKSDEKAEAKSDEKAEAESDEKAEAESDEKAETKSEDKAEAESDDESEDEDSDDESVEAKPAKEEAHDDEAPAAADHGHDDEGPEPGLERDSPRMSIITTAFVGTAFLVIGVVIGAKQFFHSMFEAEIHRKVEAPVSQQLLDLHKVEDERLGSYVWVNREKGNVRIPVARAQELVVARYAGAAVPAPTSAPTTQPVAPLPMDMMDVPPPAPPEGEGGGAPGEEKKDDKGEKKDDSKGEKKPVENRPAPRPAPPGGEETYN